MGVLLRSYQRNFLQTVSIAGAMKNSTFARYRSAEAAAEERMRSQREARLERHAAVTLQPGGVPCVANARMPQRCRASR